MHPRGTPVSEQPIEIRTPFVLDFSGNDHKAGDFRPKVSTVQPDTEEQEEVDPKDSSAQVPAPSSDSSPIVPESPEKIASVEKDSGQPKVNVPGKPTLSPGTSTGNLEPTAKA